MKSLDTIKKKEDSTKDQKDVFKEIIQNINSKDFNLNDYKTFNNVMAKKKSDQLEKRVEKNIDYSTGGLQVFKKKETKK